MSAPVDVLQVMDETCDVLTEYGQIESAAAVELKFARAAVVELIEAAKEDVRLSIQSGIECGRLQRAIARIGGES